MNQYSLGEDAARFSVVSFAANATTRVPWSYDAAVINGGIDSMTANGKTSISDGFEAAGQLFVSGRESATKIVLLFSDGGQTVDAAPGKTPLETAIDAAALVKGSGVTVFAWGFGNKLNSTMLEQIATDSSKALLVQDLDELDDYLEGLEGTICNESPPPAQFMHVGDNFCTNAQGIDQPHISMLAGNADRGSCETACWDSGDCSGIEWYEAGWGDTRCFRIPASSAAAKASPGGRHRDAECWVRT